MPPIMSLNENYRCTLPNNIKYILTLNRVFL